MDKNTLIGLGLIGVILATFTYFNQPTPEEIKKGNELVKKEQAKTKKEIKSSKEISTSSTIPINKSIVADSLSVLSKNEIIELKNNKITAFVATKGGMLDEVKLNDYKSYHQFAKNKSSKKTLSLFKSGNSTNSINFTINNKTYKSKDLNFNIVKKSKQKIVLETLIEGKEQLEFIYSLKPEGFELDFEVKFNGINQKIDNPTFEWEASLSKSERLLSEQRRVSTVCFKSPDKESDYLSEVSNDEEKIETPLEWVAFKQSYFSTIIRPNINFNSSNSSLKITNFGEQHPKYHTHIKKYSALLGLTIPSSKSIKMNWYFGPNDYEVLKSYDSNYEDIINYGWGLFRWINIYAIQPMFNAFADMGIGLGIVILLITIIIKLVLTPIQWKMYVSSAKMRILKPEIDELNAKFPNKEDAMKKQMEMMSLYKESGANPMAGCIPMLIQMPILLSIFRFFPAAFELRQQSFLWAEDLSSFDSIYDFGSYIPLYGDHVSLFTLLMAATTLVYTYINSGNVTQPQQPGMPDMKVIMYIFPFMMIFFFNNYSAGLSYYYFISTLISIIIMLAIKHFFVDEDKLRQKMAAKKIKASATPKKKSKFQERLESMQKMQQERLKKK
jgi:YidC/Oxa1 family membrane protein insertase